ncbi:hypothetical protein ACFLQU_03855 [Verrucomicrobiota bacterium]
MGDAPMITPWAGGSYQAAKKMSDDMLREGIAMRDKLKMIPKKCPYCGAEWGEGERLANYCLTCKKQ